MTQKLYKIIDIDGNSCNGGDAKWFLPTEDGPGKWMPACQTVDLCASGYHIMPWPEVVDWCKTGRVLYEAEGDGPYDSTNREKPPFKGKVAYTRARLVKCLGVIDVKTKWYSRKTTNKCSREETLATLVPLHLWKKRLKARARYEAATEERRFIKRMAQRKIEEKRRIAHRKHCREIEKKRRLREREAEAKKRAFKAMLKKKYRKLRAAWLVSRRSNTRMAQFNAHSFILGWLRATGFNGNLNRRANVIYNLYRS